MNVFLSRSATEALGTSRGTQTTKKTRVGVEKAVLLFWIPPGPGRSVGMWAWPSASPQGGNKGERLHSITLPMRLSCPALKSRPTTQEPEPQIRTGPGQDLKSCRDGNMSGPPGLMCVLGRVGGKTHVREAGSCRTPDRSDSLIRFLTSQELIIDYFDLLPQRSAEDLLKHLFSAQTNASESPRNILDLPAL